MLFSNEKYVIGLFDNDQDVEEAVQILQDHGFGAEDEDELQILDQNRLAGETPIVEERLSDQTGGVITAPAETGRTVPVVSTSATESTNRTVGAERNIQEQLTGYGLSDEEAAFYARHLLQDGLLVVVETDADRISEAVEAMKKTNARVATAE